MRAKLLAIAAILGTVIGGGVILVSWNDPVEELPLSFGAFEVVDKALCSVSVCNSAACQTALNILADGGVTDATMRFVECPVRLAQQVRNLAADAGTALPATKYAQMRLTAMRRNGVLGIAVDDGGWPIHAVLSIASPCAWKPSAGAACSKVDGGDPGVENTLQPGEWVGAACVRKSCVVVAGDDND